MTSHMDEAWPLLAQRSNATESRVGNPGNGVLTFYLILNLAPSHFFLPLLVITLLLARARRNVLLVNACITWIITGLVSCILLYSGHQTGPEPPTMVCISQASLLYAVPPMVATSILALVFQVWNNLVWRPGEKTRGVVLSIIVVLPYVVYFSFSAVGAMIASREPTRVSRERRFFYCSINHEMFSNIVALFAAFLLVITTILEVWVGITVYRNNRYLKKNAPRPLGGIDTDKRRMKPEDLQFALRVAIFGVYILIGLSLSLLSIAAPTSPVPDVVFATMGIVVFLVFGTQPKVWMIWAEVLKPKDIEKESHVPTLTPYQLDPLPGAEAQPQPPLPEMAGVSYTPPVTRFSKAGYGAAATPRSAMTFPIGQTSSVATSGFPMSPGSQMMLAPSYYQQDKDLPPAPPAVGTASVASTSQMPYRSAREEKVMLAARYQNTPAPIPTAGPPPSWTPARTTTPHPYSAAGVAAASEEVLPLPPPRLRDVQAGACMEERQSLSQLRGKLPLRPPSRDAESTFDGHAQSQSFDSQHPLRPVSSFSADSELGFATNNSSSQDVNSGYATYNSS
ncbi:hypothetical protein EXIGLDRAFT_827865, partial [Exidia glandulosa HHB12029]